jgi:hypothetical protein
LNQVQEQFDKLMKEANRGPAFRASSGFTSSMSLGDGKTLIPEKNLHSDMVRTEYRNRYNQPKPFHKITLK